MKYLDVYLRQPRWMLHPMQEFIRDGDAVEYEELRAWTGILSDRSVEYVLFYVEADREPYEAALDAAESVQWYDLTPVDDDSFYVYICQQERAEERSWRQAFADLNVVPVPPVIYDSDAAAHMTLVGTGEDLQGLLSELPDDVEVTVETIGEYDRRYAPIVGDITPRQLAAVEAAVELGFYSVPRDAGVAEVAAALDCAESTAATLLQKAEARVMRRLAGRYGRRRFDGDG